ncbi:arylsulfatase [Pseudohaliea rubra]|uniref:Arylsulfatase n=1 Tax=Pseudohaliea rubra DSM 19751 TaxID=1265313 RepID=A0A095VT15_9GAMM|nr:arylsulfatase [Pseudohaliea rubra]KGE04572.1 Arylsulfatase [Pseudohaliea rubra DSM 19751]
MILLPLALATAAGGATQQAQKAGSRSPEQRPNFLFIVADDLGFTDISRLGSEIPTPQINAIADQGILFTRFYTSAMCSPTRAMLLTGVDHHRAGLGNMADLLSANQRGKPGYEGYLNDQVVTVPRLLKDAGYHTYMAGKWHLGMAETQTPTARGFERSFALMDGAASHFADMAGATTFHPRAIYREDGELVEALPADFYSTRFYTSRLIDYIDAGLDDGKPFFAYAAYTAPHWPLQAPDDVRDKYASRYDEGYDQLRKQRFARLKARGLLPEGAEDPGRTASVPPWQQLSAQDKALAARQMEVYAAMIDDLDANIGRLLAFLRERGQLRHTFVVFLSDNGADGFSLDRAPPHIADHAQHFDQSFDNIGRANSFTFVGARWADVSEAPFRLYKTMPSEGGIRSPAAIRYPMAGGPAGMINAHTTSVMDLAPTVLELAGVPHPGGEGADEPYAMDGRSLVPIIKGHQDAVRDAADTLGIELAGRRGIIKGHWKALHIPPPAGSGRWELFDLATDPGEQLDLAAQRPEKLAELIRDWDAYQADAGIVLPERGARLRR